MTIPYSVQLPKGNVEPYEVYLDKNMYGENERFSVIVGDEKLDSLITEGGRWNKLGTVVQTRVRILRIRRVFLRWNNKTC